LSNFATATIDATNNIAPVVYDDEAWTGIGQQITISVPDNDSDPESDPEGVALNTASVTNSLNGCPKAGRRIRQRDLRRLRQ